MDVSREQIDGWISDGIKARKRREGRTRKKEGRKKGGKEERMSTHQFSKFLKVAFKITSIAVKWKYKALKHRYVI